MVAKFKIIQPRDRLCFTLYTASKTIISSYRPFLEAIDMTYPQYLVYIALFPVADMSVKQLGVELDLDSGTLTPLLKRMEKKDFVKRQRDAEDERSVKVMLTESARKFANTIAEIQYEVSCTTGLKPDEFTKLLDELNTLMSNLKDHSTS